MPTKKPRTLITLTPDELDTLRREAAENNKTLNNVFRVKIGLPELKRGGKVGNKGNRFGRSGKPKTST